MTLQHWLIVVWVLAVWLAGLHGPSVIARWVAFIGGLLMSAVVAPRVLSGSPQPYEVIGLRENLSLLAFFLFMLPVVGNALFLSIAGSGAVLGGRQRLLFYLAVPLHLAVNTVIFLISTDAVSFALWLLIAALFLPWSKSLLNPFELGSNLSPNLPGQRAQTEKEV